MDVPRVSDNDRADQEDRHERHDEGDEEQKVRLMQRGQEVSEEYCRLRTQREGARGLVP